MADLTVLYQNCERVDNVDSNDSVVFGSESLITSSLNKAKHNSIIKCCCFKSSSTPWYILVGFVMLLVGVICGFLIGRISADCQTKLKDNNLLTGHEHCNCESNHSSTGPSTLVNHRGTETTVSTKETVSALPTLPSNTNCTCMPCKTSTIQSPAVTSPTIATNKDCNVCPGRNPDVSKGNETQFSLFAPLTLGEMKSARTAVRIKLNMTALQNLSNDRISHIYLYPTPKDIVLNYLDGKGAFPGRFAKIHLIRGSKVPPDIMEYKVGPLDTSYNEMNVTQLRKDGEIAYNRRPFETFESNILYNFIMKFKDMVSPLLNDMFGEIYDVQSVQPSFSLQPCKNISDRISHMVFVLNLEGAKTLGLLPISCSVHHPGTEETSWYTNNWYYNSHGPFSSTDEMLLHYKNGSFSVIKLGANYTHDRSKEFELLRDEKLPLRFLSDVPPPRTYEPLGPRYTIAGHRVKWMGWEMEITSDPVRGPAIFDIHFLGERIAYEISLQDITLLYSSQSNGHGPLALSDTFYNIGSYNNPIKNVDCPARSHLLNATLFLAGTAISEEAMCIFEADGQAPLWRHSEKGLTDHYLVVRAALNLGNYDYVVEWNFHLDGRVKTLLTASGYLYGAFWEKIAAMTTNEDSFSPFGYKLGKYLQGPIHDHTYTFKVDLDILGPKNSFQTLNWKAGNSAEVFKEYFNSSRPQYFLFNTTRYVTSEILETETSYVMESKRPQVWTVVNEDENNIQGSNRGYRIIPETMYGEILEDHMMFKSWDQLKYQVAICQRKDNEHYASNSLYDFTHPEAPSITGSIKLDNENIRKEDLVVLISEKFYHLPTTEDVPITLAAQSGFTLKPFNYFDRTPTFDLKAHYSTKDPYSFVPCYENV